MSAKGRSADSATWLRMSTRAWPPWSLVSGTQVDNARHDGGAHGPGSKKQAAEAAAMIDGAIYQPADYVKSVTVPPGWPPDGQPRRADLSGRS